MDTYKANYLIGFTAMTNLQNMTNKLADMGVTLTVVTTQFGSKFVHIHCQNFKGISRTFICNTVSFTTAWADNAILQDAEVIKYIEELLSVSLSEDEVENTGEQKIINDIKENLNSGYAEVNNLADAYGLDHVCFEYKYSGLLYSVTVIDSLLTYVVIENTRKGQKEMTRYSATINGCEQSIINHLLTKLK